MSQDLLGYNEMVERAMRSVVRQALNHAAEQGLPGNHHFYVTFSTDHPDVVLPETLRQQYPHEMTIVLQHQFWNLQVDDEAFSVTLRFSGREADLRVPFAAMTAFADPSVEFGVQLSPPEAAAEDAAEPAAAEPAVEAPSPESGGDSGGRSGNGSGDGTVIAFDRHRKRD